MLHYVFVSSVSYVYDILQCCIAFYAALSPHYALHHVCLPLSRSVLCPPFTGKQKACNVHSTSWVGLIGAILRSKVKITEAEEGWPHISRPLEPHLLVYSILLIVSPVNRYRPSCQTRGVETWWWAINLLCHGTVPSSELLHLSRVLSTIKRNASMHLVWY